MPAKKEKTKEYNVTIAGLYKLSNGGEWSMPIDAKSFDALQKAKIGDRLLYKPVPDNIKDKVKCSAFLEIITAEKLAGHKPKTESNSDFE